MTGEEQLRRAMSSLGTRLAALSKRAVPSGGSVGQVLTKSAAADFAAGWADAPAGGWTYVRLTADLSTTMTGATDSALAFTPVANVDYEIEARLLVRSAATTTGPKVGVAVPASADHAFVITEPGATAVAESLLHVPSTSTAAANAAAAWPTANASYLCEVRGLYRAAASTSGNVRITLASEVLLSAVTLKAGSFLRYRRLN